jgi:phosphopantothenoylcysteine decarboxylase/phosphopantothenate--cysteine ligase
VRVILGVCGGIAAYKVPVLLRRFTEAGHDVQVVPTRSSLEFVGRATWEALSGKPVTVGVFENVPDVQHVQLGQTADLVVVAPATADLLSRAAAGRADDLLTAVLLTARCPVLVAPAMHTQMWEHPATRANVTTLRERGVQVLEPDSGRLTGADSGPGRMPEPDVIAAAALALVGRADLAGRTVLISAGGTREPIDPVRFIGNRSSGRQGVALARTAQRRGARVVLVGANLAVPPPTGVTVVPVETAAELRDAVRVEAGSADVVVMAAAVADFRPVSVSAHKIKKGGEQPQPIELTPTVDVLAELAAERLRTGQVVVGFAAETGDDDGDVLAHGREKARRKGADLLVVNAVGPGRGFVVEHNEVTILDARGDDVARACGTKDEVADAIWDAVVPRLRRADTAS